VGTLYGSPYISRKSVVGRLFQSHSLNSGHRHLQIGRMLDIDLISEPPPRPPQMYSMYPKCGNLCGQRGRKRFIATWGLRMSHICPYTPCPSPPGYRSKVESRHFAHLCKYSLQITPGTVLSASILFDLSMYRIFLG
jgi:hypothetical protein